MAKRGESFPQHKMGKRCGYEVYADGSIKPAPEYADRFEIASREQLAIKMLLGHVMEHCAAQQRRVLVDFDAIWGAVCEDYGLERQLGMTFDGERIRFPAKQDVAPTDTGAAK